MSLADLHVREQAKVFSTRCLLIPVKSCKVLLSFRKYGMKIWIRSILWLPSNNLVSSPWYQYLYQDKSRENNRGFGVFCLFGWSVWWFFLVSVFPPQKVSIKKMETIIRQRAKSNTKRILLTFWHSMQKLQLRLQMLWLYHIQLPRNIFC